MTEQEFLEVLSNLLLTDEDEFANEYFVYSDNHTKILEVIKDKVEQRKLTLKLNKIK